MGNRNFQEFTPPDACVQASKEVVASGPDGMQEVLFPHTAAERRRVVGLGGENATKACREGAPRRASRDNGCKGSGEGPRATTGCEGSGAGPRATTGCEGSGAGPGGITVKVLRGSPAKGLAGQRGARDEGGARDDGARGRLV